MKVVAYIFPFVAAFSSFGNHFKDFENMQERNPFEDFEIMQARDDLDHLGNRKSRFTYVFDNCGLGSIVNLNPQICLA